MGDVPEPTAPEACDALEATAEIEPACTNLRFAHFLSFLSGCLVNAPAAGWSGHRARKAIHGYEARVVADGDADLVERVDVTPGNVHDGRAGSAVVPDAPG